jgi:hypothetical protein
MDLDRGVLARIDRRVLSGLDRGDRYRMVRVPTDGAVWSAWKRYCDATGVSMGRAIAALVEHELGTVIGQGEGSVFGAEVERRLAERVEALDARKRRLDEREQALRASEQRLSAGERILRAKRSPFASTSKVGRNERCPCGSGLKYKHCDGMASRRP